MKSILIVVVLAVLFQASSVTCCKRSPSVGSQSAESEKPIEEKMEKEWPSLVGKSGKEAKEEILKKRPDLEIFILPEDSMMTMDFREDRVRILVNEKQIVVRPPKVG